MPRPRDELTAGEWAVLALLAEEPAHGFAIARALTPEGEVGQVWSVRRPLVYRTLELLQSRGLVRTGATVPSTEGPQRTVLEATPSGRSAVGAWLREPVEHVRDARSLLMLKLLFVSRRSGDPAPLLRSQRERFAALAASLAGSVERADGFDRILVLWRLESTTAALRFVETMLSAPRR
jgi:DNA-binding PadR family transcriptional regulator